MDVDGLVVGSHNRDRRGQHYAGQDRLDAGSGGRMAPMWQARGTELMYFLPLFGQRSKRGPPRGLAAADEFC